MTPAPDDGDGEQGGAGDADAELAIEDASPHPNDSGQYTWRPADEDGDIIIYDDRNPLAWVKSNRSVQESDWR